MEPNVSTRPKSPKSKSSSTATSSLVPSPTAVSPELLQTIESLQEEIAELRTQKDLTAAEKSELAQLRSDLKQAKEELASHSSPPSTAPKRIVHYGTFATVEE